MIQAGNSSKRPKTNLSFLQTIPSIWMAFNFAQVILEGFVAILSFPKSTLKGALLSIGTKEAIGFGLQTKRRSATATKTKVLKVILNSRIVRNFWANIVFKVSCLRLDSHLRNCGLTIKATTTKLWQGKMKSTMNSRLPSLKAWLLKGWHWHQLAGDRF